MHLEVWCGRPVCNGVDEAGSQLVASLPRMHTQDGRRSPYMLENQVCVCVCVFVQNSADCT